MGAFRTPDRIVLIGPSGSGKSELAGRLAAALGYRSVDTDTIIEQRAGMPVFEFFSRLGEPAFRAIETDVLADACRESRIIIATGGGVVLRPENWNVFRPGSAIIGLTADPETLVARIDSQTVDKAGSAVRPLLAGDSVSRLREQIAVRGPLYSQADYTIDTASLEPGEVVERVLQFVRGPSADFIAPKYSLPGATERSDIYVQSGVRRLAAELARRRWPRSRRAWIVTDECVAEYWGTPVERSFSDAGFTARLLVVPVGESSKSFEQVERLCREMTDATVSRQDVVVALGGGVVGDLAGFVASICLRGLALMQLPTSLLAMVDSSVGGKTGINTSAGKNLVGTFNQPGLVLVDPEFLETLPAEEYRSGMAEVIKHSLIQPSTPLGGDALAVQLSAMPSLNPIQQSSMESILALNIGIKHSVVRADERESGLRMILNFGHTAGHAIEADGYRYRHGEAVALGMLVAGRIALEQERVGRRWLMRLENILDMAGLPIRFEGQASDVIDRLSRDKKNVDGSLHWILPGQDGGVQIASGIDIDSVRRALLDIGAR